jgi:DNA-binding winged helix-turn-helix (wHTH) protein
MSSQAKHFYEFGPFRLDADNGLLLREGEVVPLQRKAFDMLLLLVRRHGQVLKKDELLEQLWPDTVVEESNLTQNVYLLRKALGEASDAQKYILTVPGRGYVYAKPPGVAGTGVRADVA